MRWRSLREQGEDGLSMAEKRVYFLAQFVYLVLEFLEFFPRWVIVGDYFDGVTDGFGERLPLVLKLRTDFSPKVC